MPEPENTEAATAEENPTEANNQDQGEQKPPRHVPVEELAEERKARKAAEKDLTDLRKKVKDFEDRDKTEKQKDADRIAELEKLLADRETELSRKDQDILRRDIAKDKGVPLKLVTGSTREEMEASADDALEWRGGDKVEKKPIGALRSGASAATHSDPKTRAAAALRGLHRG